MNFNKHSLLAISLAAILSLSVIAMAGLPEADAAKNKGDDKNFWKKFLQFIKKPDFQSDECIFTPNPLTAEDDLWIDFVSEDGEGVDCEMQAWLDKRGKALHYKIKITGMELVDTNNMDFDDVWGSHIHEFTMGEATNPRGPHILDVFGNPKFEDSDVVVRPAQGIITGIWTDSDDDPSEAANHKLTPYLEALCDGRVFTAVHGQEDDDPEPDHFHSAPYMKMKLEPTKSGDRVCKKLGL